MRARREPVFGRDLLFKTESWRRIAQKQPSLSAGAAAQIRIEKRLCIKAKDRVKAAPFLKKACEPGDYRMRCFGVLYLRNEGFAGRAEGSAPCGPVSCLSSTAWGACEKIRAVCHNPPAAICAKNISQAKNAVVARVNCYIMRRYAAKHARSLEKEAA